MVMADKKANKTKRHCMVVYALYPVGETRVQREAEALINHGYEVDVICLRVGDDPPAENHRGVQIYRELRLPARLRGGLVGQFLRYFRFLISATATLTRLHRQRPYDSIQVHNLPDFLVFCALIPKLSGVPIILDIHDLMPEFYAARVSRGMSHWLTRMVILQERLSCRFADHVITVTELWRRTLIERGVPAEKVSVVMNVADNEVFQSTAQATCPKDNDRFHLLYHGTQVQRYGIDLILHAVDRLRVQIPEILLRVHGNGNDHSTLVQLADQLNLNDHVQFTTDFVPVSDLPKIIRSADVGIVPYRQDIFTDGILPTKLMEYVALGVPVIAARTRAIEGYFDDTMVEFFTPGNLDELVACILRLYLDPSRRTTLAHNASKFNKQYSWANLSADYVALIECLTAT